MIQKDLIKKLTDYRGQVLVEVTNFDDSFWVQAVKSDLIHVLKTKFTFGEETGFVLDENGYFGKDYSCGN